MAEIIRAWSRSLDILNDLTGAVAPGGKLYFFNDNTSTPLTVYYDDELSTPHTHPVICDAKGRIPLIFLPPGKFRVRAETASGELIFDVTGVVESFEANEGGGGGDIGPEQVYQTGHIIFQYNEATDTGFVKADGTSIGSASSGASGRANADTEALYTHLWNKSNGDDTPLAVTGGRGSSASADFAANKAIATPDYSNVGVVYIKL